MNQRRGQKISAWGGCPENLQTRCDAAPATAQPRTVGATPGSLPAARGSYDRSMLTPFQKNSPRQPRQNGAGRFGASQDSLRPVRFACEAVKRVLNAFLKAVELEVCHA